MPKTLKKLLIITLTIAASFAVSRFALAQGLDLGMNYGAAIGLGDADPRDIIVNVIKIALSFLGIIAVLIIMYGGWLWMTAGGDAAKVDKAKKVLTGAVIGLIIILSAFLITAFIASKMGEVTTPGTPTATCDAGNVGACSGCQRCADLGGGSYSWIPDNTCSGCTLAAFVATAIQPPQAYCPIASDNTTIRNAVIRIYFNKNVDPNSVSSDSVVIQESNSQCPAGALSLVAGEFTISGKVVEFRPSAGTCPVNPCSADKCFAADSTIDVEIMTTGSDRVTVNGGVEQVQDNLALDEHIEFFTNDLIDCEAPSVALESAAQVCIDAVNDLGAVSSDDSGVSQVEFSDNNGSFAFLGGSPTVVVPCPGPGVCGLVPAEWILPIGSVQWQPTVAGGYSAGTDYTLTVVADDLDDNESGANRTFNLKPAHCCNGILDEAEGEDGVDCGGPCASCAGMACGASMNDDCGLTGINCHANDDICASNFCDCVNPGAGACQAAGYALGINDCCLCQNEPIIDWLSPVGGFCAGNVNTPCQADVDCSAFTPADCNQDIPNGAIGNFVTLGGRFFGTSPGTVYFSDSAGNPTIAAVLANNPAQGNPSCGTDADMWQDSQIIAVVPAGASEGPVKITTTSGYEDITDDIGSGEPIIYDFIVNNIERPGLCLASPDSGYFMDLFNLQGIKFFGTAQEILFGNETTNTKADDINFTSNTSANAAVPNITAGNTTVFAKVDNIGSNFLQFEAFYDASIQPIIDYIDPPQGPVGQYITIYGSNFRTYEVGVSFVEFDNGAGGWVYADTSFPEECQDSWWQDSYIIVKVPSVPAGGREVRVANSIGTSSPADFNVTIGEPGPGLCLIDPRNGPVGQSVEAFGDNFRAAIGIAEFYNAVSGPITGWDSSNVQTNVPSGAETGPFKIIDNLGNKSNTMPFTVGICTSDSDCFLTEECCAAGTYWSGICRTIGTCSDGAASLGGFGWMFTTAVSPITPPTCGGFSSAASCSAAGICPNSPGECQTGTAAVTGDCSDSYCNSAYSACLGECVYDAAANRCRANGIILQTYCDETNILLISGYTAQCQKLNNQNIWQINTGGSSCPLGSFMDLNGWCTVGTLGNPSLCEGCDSGFNCQDSQCFIGSKICANNSACSAGECILNNNICECCCRTSPLYSGLDCCIGLTCEPGGCGDDPVNYGLCSGCRVELDYDLNTVTAFEQLLSDNACGCPGHSGKYCRITGSDSGVCVDKTPCDNNPYNSVCDANQAICAADQYCDIATCFCEPSIDCDDDPISGCQENDSICPLSQYCDDTDCLCDYKYCNAAEFPTCSPDDNLCDITAGESCDPASCICASEGGSPGTECVNTSIPACDSGAPSCSTSLECIDNVGSDCRCCCDPLNDQCASPLECYADQAPCDGPARGLCCGCSSDSECGGGLDGCGIDTCCHARPNIISNYPLDESDPLYNSNEICRNTAIIANFDQEMDASSFSGNVIVVGDYGSGQCPSGTNFLTSNSLINKDKNLLTKAFSKILNIFKSAFNFIPKSSKLAKAYEPVGQDHNYCAITGNVTGYNDAADKGVLVFNPTQMLDANIRYYVIIKGDSNTTDNKPVGVLSSFDIGMDGGSTEKFNSINYVNSYIWSFEAGDKICKLSYVKIDPSSYLFQSANETQSFHAYPKSSSGQDLSPIPNIYNWSWNWSSDNSSVATVTNSDNPQQTVTSQNVKDNNTYIKAKATITEDIITIPSSVGQTKEGKAKVYVFLCENPWPPVPVSGIWNPWIDDSANCTIVDGGCANTNYEFYYCKDTGSTGTSDDLPAILSDSTIIRGSSTAQNVLKEAYYLREEMPTATTTLNIVNADTGVGARVSAFWNAIAGVDGYKIYWGKSSATYTSYKDVGLATTIFLDASDGLINDKAYYFNLTSYYASGAEGSYLDEVEFTPFDATAPVVPTNLIATAGDGEIELMWDANTDDAASYNVYYGVSSGLYGSAEDVGDATSAIVTGLTNGTTYYFTVTAADSYGNESDYSNEEMATPAAP